MIRYHTNWMGPVNQKWIEEHGDCWSGGRIDIHGLPDEEYYDGRHEYSLPIMRNEDWNALSDYLWGLTTEELLPYDILIEQFETHYGKRIRWMNESYPRSMIKTLYPQSRMRGAKVQNNE